MSCSRQTDDPLLKAFLKDFQINLLNIPRKSLDVGRLFVKRPDGTLFDCAITDVFQDPATDLVDDKQLNQPVPRIDANYTDKMSTKLGLSIVDKLYRVFGASVSAKLESAYRNSSAVRIQLRGVTRDEAHIGRLAEYLNHTSVRAGQTLFVEGDRLFVVASVFRAESLDIEATDSGGSKVDVDAEVAELVKIRPEVEASATGGMLMKYKGKQPLAIGVRLLEIKWQDGGSPRLDTVKDVLRVAGFAVRPDDYRQIGDDVFIDVAGGETP